MRTAKRLPRQASLFDTEVPALRYGPPPEPAPAWPSAGGQLPLFTTRTALLGLIERAIDRAELLEASSLYDRLRERGAAVPDLGFLERCRELWAPVSPRAVYASWQHLDREIVRYPARRRQVRDAVLARLLAELRPDELRDLIEPTMVNAVASVLVGQDRCENARAWIRDALLAGCPVASEGLGDREVEELLMEPYGGPWLASLGAMRGTWSLGPPTRAWELDAVKKPLAPDLEDDERAVAFWLCLRVSAGRGVVPEACVLEARRRMRLLNPALHREYMLRLEG